MSRWDIILYAVACYVAIMTLVNLMRHRRIRLENDLRQQFERQRAEAKRQQEEQDHINQLKQQQQQFEDYIRQKQKEVA